MRVLFVCSGNICRSPMAAEYTRRCAAREGLSQVVVESAGLLGIEGAPASPEAVQVLREAGIDLSRHRSRGLEEEDLVFSDLVLVMERGQREEIDRRFPGWKPRIRLLRAFERSPTPISEAPDLEDPIGLLADVYRERFQAIRTCVDHLILHLKQAP